MYSKKKILALTWYHDLPLILVIVRWTSFSLRMWYPEQHLKCQNEIISRKILLPFWFHIYILLKNYTLICRICNKLFDSLVAIFSMLIRFNLSSRILPTFSHVLHDLGTCSLSLCVILKTEGAQFIFYYFWRILKKTI